MPVLESRSIKVQGFVTPLLEGGNPHSEEAVVFVHGNPGSGRDWEVLGGEVAQFARVVAPDMPGFGRAEKSPAFDYTVQGYANHLNALIEQLGVRRAHLVLHDFGGPWGLAWAAAHPDAVASLTLFNVGVLQGYRWHFLARIWRTPLLGELFQATATRSAFRQLTKWGNPRGLPPAMVDRMYDDYDAGTRRAVLKLYRATGNLGELADTAAASLRQLRCPVLVIWGRCDPYVPVAYAERQREVFPQAEVHILDRSGHWPFADDPDAVSALALPFLRRQFDA